MRIVFVCAGTTAVFAAAARLDVALADFEAHQFRCRQGLYATKAG
jgi:hypothetical protein